MTPAEFDVVIVGAGFAGLACAERAASRGLRTLVLERHAECGAGLHTTGLLVQEVVERWRPPDSLVRRIETVRLYSPSLHCVELSAPGYGFYATDTPALMRWLGRRATDAGAQLRCAAPFRQAIAGADRIELPDYDVSARFLVGADGARSRVARVLGLAENRRFLLGVEVHCAGVAIAPDALHCFLDSELAPGYIGWVFRGAGGVAQIGLATRLPQQPDLDAFVGHVRRVFDLRVAARLERRGGLIPVGGPLGAANAPRVLLLGDAAGIVSPLTGGGIRTSLEDGVMAADAIADHLLAGGPEPGAVLDQRRPRFGFKRLLRAALDWNPPNRLLDAALRTPLLPALARRVYFARAPRIRQLQPSRSERRVTFT